MTLLSSNTDIFNPANTVINRPITLDDLPLVNSDNIEDINYFYKLPILQTVNFKWQWRFCKNKKVEYQVIFDIEGKSVAINILDSSQIMKSSKDTVIDWRDYSGFTQRLAWTIANSQFISALEDLLGGQCLLKEIRHSDSVYDINSQTKDDTIPLDFTVNLKSIDDKKDGLTTDGQSVFGQIALCNNLIERIKEKYKNSNILLNTSYLNNVHCYFSWSIDCFSISAKDVHNIRVGSLIRLDNKSLLGKHSRITISNGSQQFLGSVNDHTIKLVGSNDSVSLNIGEVDNMIEEVAKDEQLDTPHHSYTYSGIDEKQLQVNLRFEAGKLTVPLADIKNIQPGYIFDLDKKLEDRSISIYANESIIAKGQLVALGNLVAVKVTELLT